MKKAIIFFLVCVCSFSEIKAQKESFRFKKPVVMCPVDYSVLTTKGITATSLVTIDVITTTKALVAGDNVPVNSRMTGSRNTVEITDTVFKYSVISNKGMAFDIIQAVGSFTLIKLWNYKAYGNVSAGPVLSEYELISNQTRSRGVVGIANRLRGIRKVTYSEASMISTDTSITVNSQVDPSKDYYLIKTVDLDSKTEDFEYKQGAWNIGLMYLPVKIRPFATKSGVFDFSSDISVGTSFSWTMHHNFNSDWTANLLVYTGISSVKIDSLIAGDVSYNSVSQNITAFSPAIGMYWEKKGIQLGYLIGMDFLAGKLQKSWAYRSMPWFSLTAGINLFKITNNSSGQKGENVSK